jgi:hypothetical protein
MLVDPGDLNLGEGYFILLGPYRQRQLDGHEFDYMLLRFMSDYT